MYFNNDETSRLNDLVRQIEKRAGIEVVAAVVGKCDSYPEIPWKAFALAAAAGALAHTAAAILLPGWSARYAPLIILGAGAVFALLSVFWPSFSRLFLDRARAETEVDQYARALFLQREIFRTRDRTGILVLIALFERKVVIVPDKGVNGRLSRNALDSVIGQMTPHLRSADRFQALARGLAALDTELLQAGFVPSDKGRNEIADEIIQQKGEDR